MAAAESSLNFFFLSFFFLKIFVCCSAATPQQFARWSFNSESGADDLGQFPAWCDLWNQKCPFYGSGLEGKTAAYFDGVDDSYYVGNAVELKLQNASFTFSVWVKPIYYTTTTGDLSIFATDVGGVQNLGFHITLRNQKPYLGFWGNDFQSARTVPQDVWTHVVYRYDMSSSTMSLFLNGVGESQPNHIPFQGVSNIYIGRFLTGNYFKGALDELELYSSALSDSDVYALFNRKLTYLPDTYTPSYGPNHLDCLNGGSRVDSWPFDQKFTCNCTGTGYSGANCEVNFLPTAAFSFDGSFTDSLGRFAPQCSGTCPSFAAGRLNQSLANSAGTALNIASTGALQLLNSSFTVTMWVYPIFGPTADESLVSTPYNIPIPTSGALHLNLRNRRPYMGFYGNDYASAKTLTANTWYHLAYRYSLPRNEMAIYVNGGEEIDTISHGPLLASAMVSVGAWKRTTNDYFVGNIDELNFWNYTLSADHINRLYLAGLSRSQDTDMATNGPNGYGCQHSSSPVDLVPNDGVFTCNCSSSGFLGPNCDISPPPIVSFEYEQTLSSGAFVGSCAACPSYSTTNSLHNTSLSFDGVQYLTYANTAAQFGLTSSFTVMLWVKVSYANSTIFGDNDDLVILSTSNSSATQGIQLLIRRGQLFFSYDDLDVAGLSLVPEGVWTHIAFRYNQPLDAVSLLVNGVLDATDDTINNTDISRQTLVVGGLPSGAATFHGGLDDLRFYPAALDDDLIHSIFLQTPLNQSCLPFYVPSPECNCATGDGCQTVFQVSHRLSFEQNIADSGGVNATCAPSKCPSYVPGIGGNGYAAYFDGTDEIAFGNATQLGFYDSSFTVFVWVKPEFYAGNFDLTIMGSNEIVQNTGLHLVIRHTVPYFGFYGNDMNYTTALPNGVWSHLVYRYERFSGTMTIFVNGVGVKSPGHPSFKGTGGIYIGRWHPSNFYFKGAMDELVISNSAVSDVQVDAMFHSTLPDTFTPSNGPFGSGCVFGTPVDTVFGDRRFTCACSGLYSDANCAIPKPLHSFLFDSTVSDVYGLANGSCSLVSCPSFQDGVHSLQSAAFDGSQASVLLPSSVLAEISNKSFSLSAWVKPSSSGAVLTILGSASIRSQNSSTLHFAIKNQLLFIGFGQNDFLSSFTVTPNVWSHVAFSFDADAQTFTLFFNGLRQTDTNSHSPLLASGPVTIGSLANGSFFAGNIDNLYIYQASLTQNFVLDSLLKGQRSDTYFPFNGPYNMGCLNGGKAKDSVPGDGKFVCDCSSVAFAGSNCQYASADACVSAGCSASDQCSMVPLCTKGLCNYRAKLDFDPCDDGNLTTVFDVCYGGKCIGYDPCQSLNCTAIDQCHIAGVCFRGVCSNPSKPDYTGCDDGDKTTSGDVCLAGVCQGKYLTPAPINYWSLNENLGTSIGDAGTIGGSVKGENLFASMWVKGFVGSGVQLNYPLTNLIQRFISSGVGPLPSLQGSLVLWVNPAPGSLHEIDAESILGNTGATGEKYVLYSYPRSSDLTYGSLAVSAATNGISVYLTSADSTRAFAPVLVWAGNVTGWTHVGVVFDGRFTLYINGSAVRVSSPVQGALDLSGQYQFGGNALYGVYSGQFDEVRLFNQTLTANQVWQLYRNDLFADPVHYWPLDELGGIFLDDQALSNANGMNVDGTWILGRVGGALRFDGQTTGVRASFNSSVVLTGDFSLSFWVSPLGLHQVDQESQSGTAGISGQKYLVCPDFLNVTLCLSVATNGFAVYQRSASYFSPLLVNESPLNGWNWITLVLRGGVPMYYLNGQYLDVGLPVSNPIQFKFDSISSSYGNFEGSVDEIRLLSLPQDPSQISALFSSSIRLAPLGYWAFEETTGYVAFDSSPFRQNGIYNALTPSSHVIGAAGYGVAFNGLSGLIDIQGFSQPVRENFTITFWCNPNAPHELDLESTTSTTGLSGQRYVLFPTHGGSAPNAGAGVSVGTNGISVYEHTANYLPPLLSWTGAVNGWVFVAVVYMNNRPSLYMGSKSQSVTFLRQGLQSPMKVFVQPLEFGGDDRGGNKFSGTMDEFRVFGSSLSIAELNSILAGDAQRDPLLRWTFDDGAGVVAQDFGPSMITGYLANMNDDSWYEGRIGFALKFNGGNQTTAGRVRSNSTLVKTLKEEFTVSFWALPFAAQALSQEYQSTNAGNANNLLYVVAPTTANVSIASPGSSLGISFGNNGLSVFELASDSFNATLVAPMAVSQWTMITLVYRRNQPTLYVNGQYVRQGSTSPNTVWLNVEIGGFMNNNYNGLLDELRIYSRALSPVDIRALYDADTIRSQQALGIWRMDNGRGYVFSDDSSFDHNGIINNVRDTTWKSRSGGYYLDLNNDGLVNQYISFPHPVFAGTESFTVSFWVKPSATITFLASNAAISGQHMLVLPAKSTLLSSSTSVASSGCSVGTNGIQLFEGSIDGGYFASCSLSTPITDWTAVSYVYTNNVASLYINGQLSYQCPRFSNNSVHLILESLGFVQDNAYMGGFDNFRVFSYALSAGDLQTLYSTDFNYAPTFYWPFDAGSGNVAYDYGPYNNSVVLNFMSNASWIAGRVGFGLDFNIGSENRQYLQPSLGSITIKVNFTMSLWLRPTATHQIDAETSTTVTGTSGQRYAIWPYHGDYIAAGSAGAGISAGINGISVYEHAGSYMPSMLVWAGDVTQWTHVTVVYNNNRPTLYINGQFARQGLQSSRTVYFWSTTTIGNGQYGEYKGSMDELRVWTRSLSVEDVDSLYRYDLNRVSCGSTILGLNSNGFANCSGDTRPGGTNCIASCKPGFQGTPAPYSCGFDGFWFGSLNCTACPLGTASNSNGTCDICPAGTYTPQAQINGPCASYNCSVGTYDHDSNPLTLCLGCPSETYQPLSGATLCLNATVCAPGYEQVVSPDSFSDRVCRKCAVGYWKKNAGQTDVCIPQTACVNQIESVPPTSSTDRVCQSCPVGTFFVSGACQNTTVCYAGTEENTPASSTSDRTCRPCASGMFKNSSVGMCQNATLCAVGYYQSYPPTAVNDRQCAKLTNCSAFQFEQVSATATSDRLCRNCSLCIGGSNHMIADCTAFSDRVCDLCTPCSLGTYEVSSCTASSDRGCRNCTSCTAGQFIKAQCLSSSDTGCAALTNCTSLQYETRAATSSSDRECSALRICASGAEYEMVAPTATTNRVCSSLKTCSRGEQIVVPATPSSDRQCDACPAGFIDDDRSFLSPCVSCPQGVYVPPGSTGDCSLYACQAGYYDSDNNSSTPCVACPGNTFQPSSGQTVCIPAKNCSAGYEETQAPSQFTDRLCTICPVGTFKDSPGQSSRCTSVKVCFSGQEQSIAPTITSDRSCVACDGTSKYQDVAGQIQCKSVSASCAVGSTEVASPTPSSDRVCDLCPLGTFKPIVGNGPCIDCTSECPAGNFLSSRCPAGVRGLVSDGTCLQCPLGTFSNATNNNTYCDQISSTCPAGTYQSYPGSSTENSVCSACDSCSAGFHRVGGCDGTGATQCEACVSSCNVGELLIGVCNPNSTIGPSCQKCHASCANCSDLTPTGCLSCVGQLLYSNGSCVSQCPAGFYQGVSGQCLPCASSCGDQCFGPNPDQCINCDPGLFLFNSSCVPDCSGFGSYFGDQDTGKCRKCSSCPASTFSSVPCSSSEDTQCSPWTVCGSHSYETSPGSALVDRACAPCSSCPSGQYAIPGGCAGTQNTVCAPCQLPDYYQDLSGQVSCKRVSTCLNGYYVVQAATATSDRQCATCPTETFQNQINMPFCMNTTKCGLGQQELSAYSSIVDRICVSCVLGFSFKSTVSNDACSLVSTCRVGEEQRVSPTLTSDRNCTTCLVGFYQDQPGQPRCLRASVCAAGSHQLAAPTPTTDRSCVDCDPNNMEYQDEQGQLSCKRITSCSVGQSELLAPTKSNDRLCASCVYPSTYQDQPSQKTCKNTQTCLDSQFQTKDPTVSSDRGCKAITSCTSDQYQVSAPTQFTDRTCTALSTCSLGNTYESVTPTTTSNRVCSPVSQCPKNWFETRSPTLLLDRLCGTNVSIAVAQDYHSLIANSQDLAEFTSAVVQTLRLDLGISAITNENVRVTSGSILIAIDVASQDAFDKIQRALTLKSLVILYKGKSYTAVSTAESTPAASSSSSSANIPALVISIFVVVVLIVLVVVLIICYKKRRRYIAELGPVPTFAMDNPTFSPPKRESYTNPLYGEHPATGEYVDTAPPQNTTSHDSFDEPHTH